MTFLPLPRRISRPQVPPIKCQGIKTKLVDFIASNVSWDGRGRWIEPFLGSGVVLFNVGPERAIANDSNPHIINLYKQLYAGDLTPEMIRLYLTEEGEKLRTHGGDYYYKVRDRFNRTGDVKDFLFLNRSCFNGMLRFNSKGGFNVPFCHKPNRFRKAYVTKIVNQATAVARIMHGKDWEFTVGDWRDCLNGANEQDFVYLDPPYVGRHTDYYNQWTEDEANELAETVQSLPCGFAISTWKENKYRTNARIENHWNHVIERTRSHFYHVGAKESNRHSMEEALLIKSGHEAKRDAVAKPSQPSLGLD